MVKLVNRTYEHFSIEPMVSPEKSHEIPVAVDEQLKSKALFKLRGKLP